MESQSIHPRVVNGRTIHSKVNTASPRRNGLPAHKLERMQKHLAQHPRDGMTASRIAKGGKR